MIGDWTEYGAIDMAGELSKTVYDTRDKAAIGGFLSVREHHKKEWERTEFGFFVVLVMDKTKATYHYTQPEPGEGTRVSQEIPTGLKPRGFCHTHPKSDSTGDFGSDDLESFRKAVKVAGGIFYYLMNPFQELRYAQVERDFLRGKPLEWIQVPFDDLKK